MKKIILTISFLCIYLIINAQKSELGGPTIVELITFETQSTYLQQATATTDIWQIGQPSKALLSDAYSAPNAILTDTVNSYPTNNHSWFDIIIALETDEIWWVNVGIGFWHKMDTDKDKDGGYITVSYDKGVTWENIIHDTLTPFMFSPANNYYGDSNLYTDDNILFNDEKGFSGQKNKWTYTEFYWIIAQVTKAYHKIDSLMVRFNFISDNIDNQKEGWIIDNISLMYNNDYLGSVNESPTTSKLSVYPNPISDKAIIKTKDQTLIENIKIYNSNGQLIKKENVNNKEYIFEKNEIESGIYYLKCVFNRSSETVKLIVK